MAGTKLSTLAGYNKYLYKDVRIKLKHDIDKEFLFKKELKVKSKKIFSTSENDCRMEVNLK